MLKPIGEIMNSLKTIVAIAFATSGTMLLLAPAEAAPMVRKNLTCIALPVFGALSSAPPQQLAIVNNTSQAIAAGTSYTFAVGSAQRSQASPAALQPGKIFHVYAPQQGSTCTAWIMVPLRSTIIAPMQTAPMATQ
jgi:hypothetical protein